MSTITIAFEQDEDERRRRQAKRVGVIAAVILGAMVIVATEEKAPRTTVVTVTETVQVPVAIETAGPPAPPTVIIRVPVGRPAPPPILTVPIVVTRTVTTPVTTAVTTTTPAPDPAPPPKIIRNATVEPARMHFSAPGFQRATITNPHKEPIEVASIEAMGVAGAPVLGYRIDSRRCIGPLAPGAKCAVTVLADYRAVRFAESIEIKVTLAQ